MPRKTTARRVHVALLRGINVGRAKRVAMADLKALVEGLGYRDVRTLLNSGNVVFSAPAAASGNAASRIEGALPRRLKVSARVLVLSAAELAKAIAENPLVLPSRDPSRLLVTVFEDPAHHKQLLPLARRDWGPEALAIGSRVAYLWCPAGIIQSAANEAVAQVLGDGATTRNWNTMLRLDALASAT
jgi:uncharacterized protein (DUF1697 family)